jgi:hypothetical protein
MFGGKYEVSEKRIGTFSGVKENTTQAGRKMSKPNTQIGGGG